MTSAPAGVSNQQKFSASRPCPICSGHPGLPQGQGIRCWGFMSSDGSYAHCSREEKAGAIAQGPDATYAHRMRGGCKCGVQHGPAIEASTEPVAIYRYGDFEKGRFEGPTGKSFSWRRVGTTGWPKGASGAKMHDLPLLGAESVGYSDEFSPVIFTEGEKARQALEDRGYIAVCAGGGAGQKQFGTALDVLEGLHLVLWPDNDSEGEKYAVTLANLLKPKAASLRLIRWREAPPKGDAYDFFAAGGTDEQLKALIAGIIPEDEMAEFEPKPIPVARDYSFTSVTQSTFVQQYIEYRQETSDAPLEYAEALALGVLSAVVGPRLRIPLRTEPVPLNTSLYILLLGPSSVYRKSNSLKHAELLAEEVVPAAMMSTPGSPEGFVQDMGLHWETGALWMEDEFASTFQRFRKPYYADIRGWLLRMYDGFSISRRNRTKKTKAGDVSDVDVVRNPALTMLTGATPERLAEVSTRDDVEDGFWPRWIAVWPQSRPPFQLIGPPSNKAVGLRNTLRNVLGVLHERRLGALNGTVQGILTAEAWAEAEKHELRLTEASAKDLENGAFYGRAITRIFKVAGLLALVEDVEGREKSNVIIHPHHIADAAALVDRWLVDMLRFAETVGLNEFEKQLDRAWRALVRLGGEAPRRRVAIASRLSKRQLDEIQATLEDRGLLETIPGQAAGSVVWKALRGQKE